jgi:Hypothetical glycosyl hydrolase 6/Beta-galactosidase trimerisation domain
MMSLFEWNRRDFLKGVGMTPFLTALPLRTAFSSLPGPASPQQGGWFSETRRKVHILYVSPAWAKDRGVDFDAEAYAENLSRAGVKTVELYTKDHHGYVYFKSQTGRQYPRDVLGEMLTACHKRGIKLIAYYSVAFDNYASGIHPEWLQVSKDGQFRDFAFTRMICLNSPYTDFALEQIQELVTNYDVDGLWLDIMPVTWHEFKKIGWWGELDPFCYCIYCRRKYQRSYQRDIPMDPDLQESLTGYQMQVDGARRFMEKAKALLKQHRPNSVLTYNGSGGPEDPLTIGDLISIEGHPPAYYHQSMLVRWAQGQNRPMEILSAGALSGWDGWDQKPVNMMRLETSIALAHGCGVTVGQQPYPRGNPEQADFKAFKVLFDWVSKMEEYARTPVSVSDIGVYLSLKSWDAPQLGVPALGETEGIHTALLRDQWQYDILKDLSTLDHYKLVIVGEHRAMSDTEVSLLRNYVHDGGRLLVTGLTGLYDERGKKRSDFALADVLGVSYLDANHYPHYYSDQHPPGLLEGEAFKVQPRDARILTNFLNPETIWTKGTTVLWQDPPPDPAQRYPLVTVNQFGNGRCVYIAASIGNTILQNVRQGGYLDTYAVKLFRDALGSLGIEPAVVTTAMGTEVVLNRHGANHVLHLINYVAGLPLWLSRPDRGEVRDVEVAIRKSVIGNPSKATEIATGKTIPVRREGEWVKFKAPPYQVSTAILL